jgi:hypothetical protein
MFIDKEAYDFIVSNNSFYEYIIYLREVEDLIDYDIIKKYSEKLKEKK